MRRLVAVAGVVMVLAALALYLRPRPAAPATPGPPAATLLILTGSAQVTRAGAGTAEVARSGDQLRAGDRINTGPGTRARLTYADGDQSRLDSATTVVVAAAGLRLLAGQAWSRNLSGGRLAVAAAGRTFQSNAAGDEFVVSLAGAEPAALAYAGSVPGAATATAADRDTPWAALNETLDRDPSKSGPAALGEGDLLPGEQSAAQQGVVVPPGPGQDVYFTAGWTSGDLQLAVIDPSGKVFATVTGPSKPVAIRVPRAAAGGWEYRVRQLSGGDEGDDWFVVMSLLPA